MRGRADDQLPLFHTFCVDDRIRLDHPLRDIIGNLFRPVALDPLCQTTVTVAISRHMYDSRDFSPMPVLADAGCDHAGLLSHCRGAGPHVRGCWLIDRLLKRDRRHDDPLRASV